MIKNIETTDSALTVAWNSGQTTTFPFIWLRDIDPIGFHPQTKERQFDLTSVDIDLTATDLKYDETGVTLSWPDQAKPSFFPVSLLQSYAQHCQLADAAKIPYVTWQRDFSPERFSGGQLRDQSYLLALLTTLKRDGVVIVTDLTTQTSGDEVGQLISFKRETNFGVMFEVVNKADPNNLAYTSVALPLHTDLPNQELPPGYQFLHCIKNEAQGGESLLADGFRIAQDMKKDAPAMYQTLVTQKVPFRFFDDSCDIRFSHHLIEEQDSKLQRFTFNAHIADNCGANVELYRAYQVLMKYVRNKHYELNLKLASGEMVIFDNRRVLHGRNEFDPSSGDRHLRGFYIDSGEIDSKIRVLNR